MQHEINDKAVKDIEKLFEIAHTKNVLPEFKKYKNSNLTIKRTYIICNNCCFIKTSKFCIKCNIDTPSNSFIIYDLKTQIINILQRNLVDMEKNKANIQQLGYPTTSIIYKFHTNNPNGYSFTLNTDGLKIFNNNSKGCWPFFLAINEIKIRKRFTLGNIILAGL